MKETTPTTQSSRAPIQKGVVVSDASDKTIVVKVDMLKAHPKYLKRYRVSKRYHVHDETNQYHVGDTVFFQECKPYSKQKKHAVVTENKKA
jgi:small subunit ribosomal protein S17